MSRRSRLFIDLALLVGLLVANDPARTGLAVHEWLSIALIVPLLVHLVINWEWTVRVTAKFFERLLSTSRLNLMVDVALFASTVSVMVSGFAVSKVLAGLLGMSGAASPIWVAVHSASAAATIVMLLVHFALHGTWFVQTITSMSEGRASAGSGLNGARTVRNSLAVLGVTAVLVVAILLTVSGTGVILGPDATTATTTTAMVASDGSAGYSTGSGSGSISTGTRTCPRTGCTASTCHAETGQSPYAQ